MLVEVISAVVGRWAGFLYQILAGTPMMCWHELIISKDDQFV
jgi:hypothetical protein